MFHVKHGYHRKQYFYEIKTILPNVSRETLIDLEAYAALLQQWQKHINLIANATLPILWQRHIIDSVQLFPLAAQIKASEAFPRNWLDVGSGGGFPGLVMAILAKHSSKTHITMIESNGKKAAFLRMVVAKLHLPARIINQRIEASYQLITTPEIITARALAELPKLLTMIAPFFERQRQELLTETDEGKNILALLPKGQGYLQEIEQAQQFWSFDLHKHPSQTDAESVILAIRNLRPRTPSFNRCFT